MKHLIRTLLVCIALLAGILLYCKNFYSVKSTQWGDDLLRVTDPDLLLKPPSKLGIHPPAAVGPGDEDPTGPGIEKINSDQ